MAEYKNPVNKLLTCPYDPTHRVKASRFQLHITKCRLNHLDEDKEVCPFNAQHRFDRGTLQTHILDCPDRAPVDRSMIAASNQNNVFKGHTGVPPYTTHKVAAQESWDADIAGAPVSAYTPKEVPPNRGMRTDFGHMKPAERKRYYKGLHGSDTNEEDDETLDGRIESVTPLPELKSPKSYSEAELVVHGKITQLQQNVGLGRGQPQVPPQPRIAANIFGSTKPLAPMRQPSASPFSYARAVQESSLGMGRGQGDVLPGSSGKRIRGCGRGEMQN